MKRTGQYLTAYSLEWATTTIRSMGGKTVVTDGPFVQTKKKVGGLLIIGARDLNDAILARLEPERHLLARRIAEFHA